MAKPQTPQDKKQPSPKKWWETIPAGDRYPVELGKLTFDKNNPRFTPEKRPDGDTESAIITQLAATADLAELVQSISASGYIDIEPLIVIGRDDDLVVLEGNRRLAALKVLTNPALAAAAKIAQPALPPAIAKTLKAVSVYRVIREEEARDLIGFKHINGPQVWDAYAKARYAARWLDDEKEKREKTGKGLTIAEIAHRMGDNHDTIHRIVDAAYVLDQAEAQRLFSVADRFRKGFSFSHLYTALMYWEYREFLGLDPAERKEDPQRNPVKASYFANLQRLLIWLYGSKSEGIAPQIRSQNPDLGRLRRVLGDPRSRRVMLERNDLDEAVENTKTAIERFEKSLVDADENLKKAQGSLDGFDASDDTLFEIGRSVHMKAETIHSYMVSKRGSAEPPSRKARPIDE